jgi:diphthine synthase
MLVFIGLGLYDESDLSLRAVKEAQSCERLFAEFYTSKLSGTSVEKLEEVLGKKIKVLCREEVEEGSVILAAAKEGKTGFLIPGDPLISTTHIALRINAKERGIKTQIVHNTSIYSAAPAISGLFNYKFGRSSSIPFPSEGYSPESYYFALAENRERGLHTLLFLDIKEKLMTVNEALKILLDIEEDKGLNVATNDSIVVGLGCVGSETPVLIAGRIEDLISRDFGPVPHVLIVPGVLHFMEEEYLKEFGGL